jgi:serine/threonine-protein kinase HipA
MMATESFDPREVEVAGVFKGDERVGQLRRRVDSVEFLYDPDATIDVATTLPRSASTFRTHAAGALPPFFAGLLPEGRRLTALRAAIKTSADDDFSMLLAVGSDCVGDVTIVPDGMSLRDAAVVPTVVIERGSSWDSLSFDELFASSVGGDPERSGVPGVQDKVSARMITVPIATGGPIVTTHILKLTPPEFPLLVENEAFFAEAARSSGIDVCGSEIVVDRNGRTALLVERFDRKVIDKAIRRVGQEDACQVLGLFPADKYRPTYEQVVGGLVAQCGAGPVAAVALLRQLAFAYLIGNGDAHAKNFSIVRHSGEWRASPAYDVPSSYPYRDRTMALSVQTKRNERIGRNDFAALAEVVGLRPKPVFRAIDELVERSDAWIDRLPELPFDGQRIHDLRKAIQYRRGRLLGR